MTEKLIENNKVLVVGDVHANWNHLNDLINAESPYIILQCGDFGYWPHQKINDYKIEPKNTIIYWADGNHENHENLQKLISEEGRNPIEIWPNVYYMPRCSVLGIKNKNILFIGGANSIDKHLRIPYISWWPQEEISQKDILCLPDIKIDIVVSHTLPEKCLSLIDKDNRYGYKSDFSRKALDFVLEKYHPEKWFFAHWHVYKKFSKYNCEFTCLNQSKERGWWTDISYLF